VVLACKPSNNSKAKDNHLAITGKPRITIPTSEKSDDLCKMWNRK